MGMFPGFGISSAGISESCKFFRTCQPMSHSAPVRERLFAFQLSYKFHHQVPIARQARVTWVVILELDSWGPAWWLPKIIRGQTSFFSWHHLRPSSSHHKTIPGLDTDLSFWQEKRGKGRKNKNKNSWLPRWSSPCCRAFSGTDASAWFWQHALDPAYLRGRLNTALLSRVLFHSEENQGL